MARPSRPSRPARSGRSAAALDVEGFCRGGERLDGQWSIADLPRLADSVLQGADGAADAPVQWSVAGSLHAVPGGAAHCIVDLVVRANTTLVCQRCLQPLAVPLAFKRRIRFVEGEDEAARLDEELDDDVLALAHRLDLRTLIEDELLLALPLVPRHEACADLPQALRTAAQEADKGLAEAPGEHPFAALATLRRGKA